MKKHKIGILLMIMTVWMSQFMQPFSLCVNAAETEISDSLSKEGTDLEEGSQPDKDALYEESLLGGEEQTDKKSLSNNDAQSDDVAPSDDDAQPGEESLLEEAAQPEEESQTGKAGLDESPQPEDALSEAATEEAETEEAVTEEAATEEAATEEAATEEAVTDDGAVATTSIGGQSAGTEDDDRTADELFEGYIRKEFGISTGQILLRKVSSGARLTGIERNAYDKISEVLPLIASGERTSTRITVSIDDLFKGCKNSWTAKELGVTKLLEKSVSSPTGWVVTKEALKAREGKGAPDMYKILVALLADHPYELYWFNKIVGFNMSDLDVTATADEIKFKGEAVFSMTVEKEYAAGTYEVNTKFGAAVQTSAQNARNIVERCSSYSDYDKLKAYKDEIVKLVEYDTAALTDYASYGQPPYGNPWQLIWVFDGDPSTNVVCEGYAKAFQYLCDKTAFNSDISCLTVNGETGEKHMWNIVRMEDGANYLVDLTNCDDNACGYPDKLFLVGTDGSPDKGYHFDIDLYNDITYVYDKLMTGYYDASDLKLAGNNYGEGKSISAASVTLDSTEFTYDGTRKLPAVTVTLDGVKLVEGTDYKLEYDENINAGTGLAAVTGMGSYSGVKRVQFAILKADQAFSVSPTALTLKIGDMVSYSSESSYQEPGHIVVKVSGLEGELYVRSDNPSTAGVSTDPETAGWVKAVAGGKATITLTASETENFKEKQIPLTIYVEPAATSKLNAVNLSVGMKVVWAAVPGADGYILTRSCGSESASIRIKGGSTVEYTDKAANSNGKLYTYKIAATAGSATSSSVKTATRLRVPRPAISSIASSAAGKMTLKWAKDLKAAGWQIQYSLKSDFGSFKTVNVSGAAAVSKTITGLTKGKTYYVRIRSYRLNGNTKNYSAFSKIRKVTVKK